ncbi:T9SS type A sorting domain-containing protein [Ignavibacterium sp.]|uniref:T9SS type A sorting domain-containing protein n=1 Tax=Ignavibacterium sp. TaxID=2651167 RepID=UPI00307E531C
MKIKIVILLFFGIISTSIAQWVKVSDIKVGVGGNIFSHNSTLILTGYFSGFKMYRSDNGGATWTSIADRFPYHVYDVFSYNNEIFGVTTTLGSDTSRFYVSNDNGLNWSERSNIPSVTGNGAILSLTADGNTLYAVSNRKSFYISTDNGLTWTEKIITISASGNLVSFAASGNNFVSVILGIGAVISTNGGQTWEIKNPVSSTITSVYYFNGKIFGNGGLFIFNNNTNNWDASTGLPDALSFQIPVSMTGYGNLVFSYFVGFLTSQGSVYSSSDGGLNWTILNSTGLPTTVSPGASQSAITATSTNLFLYNQTQSGSTVDTAKTGVYRTIISTTSIENLENLPTKFSLSQNYPNPFNPSTTISFTIPQSEFVTLKVYDVLGNEVAMLVTEYKSAGTYNVQFSTNNLHLSSGIYFYRIQAGQFNEVKKMVLAK